MSEDNPPAKEQKSATLFPVKSRKTQNKKENKREDKKSDKTPHYHGHRGRLRQRFLEADRALPDYEILELLLFQSIPRRDVKPLAKQLIKRFDSLAGVLSAPVKALAEFKGVSETTAVNLKVIETAAKRIKKETLRNKTVLSAWEAVIDYCHTAMARETREQFRILYLNSKNILIKDLVMHTGTINHTPVYPREAVKKALDLGATAMILVHNHPSGDPAPSPDDLEMTEAIIAAAEVMGITVHDHIIIGRDGHFSFRNKGLIGI